MVPHTIMPETVQSPGEVMDFSTMEQMEILMVEIDNEITILMIDHYDPEVMTEKII